MKHPFHLHNVQNPSRNLVCLLELFQHMTFSQASQWVTVIWSNCQQTGSFQSRKAHFHFPETVVCPNVTQLLIWFPVSEEAIRWILWIFRFASIGIRGLSGAMTIRDAVWRRKALLLTASPAAEVLQTLVFYWSFTSVCDSHTHFIFVDELRVKSLQFLVWSLCADDQLAEKAKQNSPLGWLVVWGWHCHMPWGGIMSGWCRVIEAAVDGGTEGVVQEVWGWTLMPCQPFSWRWGWLMETLGAQIETLLRSVCSLRPFPPGKLMLIKSDIFTHFGWKWVSTGRVLWSWVCSLCCL